MIGSESIASYQQVDAHSNTESANPHKLVDMLFSGALQRLTEAKTNILARDIYLKGEAFSKAISILDGLRDSLDMEQGGDISKNLDNLYDYMQRQLVRANLENNVELIDEVIALLLEVKEAWGGIADKHQGDQ